MTAFAAATKRPVRLSRQASPTGPRNHDIVSRVPPARARSARRRVPARRSSAGRSPQRRNQPMSIRYLHGWLSRRFPALALLAALLVAAVRLTLPEPEAPRPRVLTLEHRYAVSALAFTPDGT